MSDCFGLKLLGVWVYIRKNHFYVHNIENIWVLISDFFVYAQKSILFVPFEEKRGGFGQCETKHTVYVHYVE